MNSIDWTENRHHQSLRTVWGHIHLPTRFYHFSSIVFQVEVCRRLSIWIGQLSLLAESRALVQLARHCHERWTLVLLPNWTVSQSMFFVLFVSLTTLHQIHIFTDKISGFIAIKLMGSRRSIGYEWNLNWMKKRKKCPGRFTLNMHTKLSINVSEPIDCIALVKTRITCLYSMNFQE